jgi:hypothetical protein
MEPTERSVPEGPPADPDDWTDEQWIEWLKVTDAEAEAEAGAPPVTTLGKVTHSAGGQVIGQAMLGMANAIYGRHDDEIVVVAEGDGQPEPDEEFTVHVDTHHPERSTVVFRNAGEPPG